MDNLRIMQELAGIISGRHPAWTGDAAANAETFLHRIRNDAPDDASLLAYDLLQNIKDFSTETGLSPDRIKWAANLLMLGV